VLAGGPFSADAKRVALVIGNDSYQNAQVLSAPHNGTLLAAEGKWALNSPSWVDGGTYQVPNANTLVANGRLGTGYWHRGP